MTLYDLPVGQWLTVAEICRKLRGVDHDPALWKQMCHFDSQRVTRQGYRFEGNGGRTKFRWTKSEVR